MGKRRQKAVRGKGRRFTTLHLRPHGGTALLRLGHEKLATSFSKKCLEDDGMDYK